MTNPGLQPNSAVSLCGISELAGNTVESLSWKAEFSISGMVHGTVKKKKKKTGRDQIEFEIVLFYLVNKLVVLVSKRRVCNGQSGFRH
jgi:hypothetical protein